MSRNLPEHHALKLARFQLMAKTQLINLGKAIKERREQLDLSQTRLAQKFPVDPRTVSRWERGENPGAYNNLETVAMHLETTAHALQARAIDFGRDNGTGAIPEEPDEGFDFSAYERAAIRRHSVVMTELGKIRELLEVQEMRRRQDAQKAAGE